MRLDNVRRIVSEDFPKEDRETIIKLADILNAFMEQVYNGFNKNINFDNLNREITQIELQVNSSGVPTVSTKFSSKLKKVSGINVVKVENLTNTGSYPTSGVLVSFTQLNSTVYQINHITGLAVGNKYRIYLELINF